ncbi:MAG: class I SAM-dependent methyltransferase [Candidatus Aenigmarchaeota archaeon]|nr:class I SAM-dependent methyltransferase [Candidatus Aenigmarchaeota archaeon]
MSQEIGWTEKVAKEWRRYRPPSRPSLTEVRCYEHWFRRCKGKRVLILGSTPELRDLAAKYRMETTVCDWSEGVFSALKILMKHKDARETFVKQDWRTMQFQNQFDLIVGDCATTVVPFADLDAVLRNIAQGLDPGGVAVQRIWTRYKDQQYTPKSIASAFATKGRAHWYTRMLFPVFLYYYSAEKESLSGQELYEKLRKDLENGTMPEKLVRLFSLVKNHKTQNNVLLRKDLEALLGKYFIILERMHGRDNFWTNAPIYVLKKK